MHTDGGQLGYGLNLGSFYLRSSALVTDLSCQPAILLCIDVILIQL